MPDQSIVHFDKPGEQNTDETLDAVIRRVDRGGISHIVIASSSGKTAKRMLGRLSERPVQLVVVTSHCGFDKVGECEMDQGTYEEFISKGIMVIRASHVLSGIERSITKRLGGASRVEAMSEALRSLFGQGMKVCVEITVMAADNGAIPCGDTEVISIGGCGYGADTACVVRPAHANTFFDMEVREILTIPRLKRE